MTDDELKYKLLRAVVDILKEEGYDFWLNIPPYCHINHYRNGQKCKQFLGG